MILTKEGCMFNNSGLKLKMLAIVLLAVGILLSVIFSIVAISEKYIARGIVILLGGITISYTICLLLFGFGTCVTAQEQTAEMLDDIEQMLREKNDFTK